MAMISRDILIPENEWFYVGLADLAVGRTFDINKRVEALNDDDRDRFYTRGRAAGYIKGKIQGKYLLTAAIDTGDEDVWTRMTSTLFMATIPRPTRMRRPGVSSMSVLSAATAM